MHATLLLAHGSRDPTWALPLHNVVRRMLELEPQACVKCAFLELCQPDIDIAAAELVALGATTISVLPLFLGIGKHAREDTPKLVDALQQRYPLVSFILKPSVGEEPEVIELLAKLALVG